MAALSASAVSLHDPVASTSMLYVARPCAAASHVTVPAGLVGHASKMAFRIAACESQS